MCDIFAMPCICNHSVCPQAGLVTNIVKVTGNIAILSLISATNACCSLSSLYAPNGFYENYLGLL